MEAVDDPVRGGDGGAVSDITHSAEAAGDPISGYNRAVETEDDLVRGGDGEAVRDGACQCAPRTGDDPVTWLTVMTVQHSVTVLVQRRRRTSGNYDH